MVTHVLKNIGDKNTAPRSMSTHGFPNCRWLTSPGLRRLQRQHQSIEHDLSISIGIEFFLKPV